MVKTNNLGTVSVSSICGAISEDADSENTYVFFKKKTFLLTLLLCVSQLFIYTYSNTTYAQGVAAGTDIENTVIVNYKIEGQQQIPLESSPTGNSVPGIGNGQATLFKVDRKIDLSVTANTQANVAPGDTQAEVTYTLKNEGNDIQEFGFILDTALLSDDFDVTNCSMIVNAITGTPLNGVTLPTSGNIRLKADQQASISVKCDIPQNLAGQALIAGQNALLSLYATAEKNTDGSNVQESTTADTALGVETVFADGAGSDDSNRDAAHTARTLYTITDRETPILTIDKSLVGIVSPDSISNANPNSSTDKKAISGAIVTYKINITTTGKGIINNTVITDPTPTGMTYKTGSILLNNKPLTDNSDTDKADFGITQSNTVTINLGNITAGGQDEIQLSYTIN